MVTGTGRLGFLIEDTALGAERGIGIGRDILNGGVGAERGIEIGSGIEGGGAGVGVEVLHPGDQGRGVACRHETGGSRRGGRAALENRLITRS